MLPYDELIKFIDPQLIGAMVAFYILGVILKKAKTVPDPLIPFIIMVISIVITILFFIAFHETQSIAKNIYSGIIQGIICGGAPIVANNLFKQGALLANGTENEEK